MYTVLNIYKHSLTHICANNFPNKRICTIYSDVHSQHTNVPSQKYIHSPTKMYANTNFHSLTYKCTVGYSGAQLYTDAHNPTQMYKVLHNSVKVFPFLHQNKTSCTS